MFEIKANESSYAKRIFKALVYVMAVIGLVFSIWFTVATANEVSVIDLTSGGYEYPYEGWTGTPTDYDTWYATPNGLFFDGRSADLSINCTTGRLTISVLSTIDVPFRDFSDRAKVVHQPQVTCRERGFDTSAWDDIDDPLNLYADLQSPENVANETGD